MDTNSADFDLDLIERHFSGALSAAEARTLEQWVAAQPARQQAIEDLRAVWTRAGRSEVWDVDALWRQMAARMQAAEQRGVETREQSVVSKRVSQSRTIGRSWGQGRLVSRPPRQWAWYTAAGIMMGVLAMLAGWHVGTPRLVRPGLGPISSYVTANAQRAAVTLPDGNTVALNVGSRLDVPADYLAGNHTVRLLGEAVFAIVHHEGTPVSVVAGSATARVLGTTFLVRHYTTDPGTVVAVRDGKVAVQVGRMPPVVLTTARQLAIDPSGVGHVQGADSTQFGFATGVLTINGMSLREAIPELNRWYDADIHLGDARLGTWQVDGGFTAGSLAELQERLEWAFNLRVVRTGRTLTLFPR